MNNSTKLTKHLDPVRKELREIQTTPPPLPWQKVRTIAVGGLLSVGFDRESDLLLIVSSAGRGVVDCRSGQRIARDDGEYYQDQTYLEAVGIGPLRGKTLRVSGLFGGSLPITAKDGWSIQVITLDWTVDDILLLEPYASLYDPLNGKRSRFHKIGSELELRACGFSYSGHSFVVATSSEITVYGRNGV